MAFQDKLDALKAKLAGEGQPVDSTILRRALETLIATEQRDRLAKVGDRAPAFTLPDTSHTLVSSATLLSYGPLVVTFYRGLWCPYCQRDLYGFKEALPDIRSAGASIAAISHQFTSGDSRVLQHAREMGFPVLDDEGDVAVRFGLRWSPNDARLIEELLGLDLFSFRGTEPWIVPMQARYVIGQDGIIVFAEAAFDYSQRSEPVTILPVLVQLPRPSGSTGRTGDVS